MGLPYIDEVMAYRIALRIRAVPIKQLFLLRIFSSYFFKVGKTGNTREVWKFNRGENIWKLRIAIFVGKKGKSG